MQTIAPNLQKTSVSLGNLRVGDWWWWEGRCQGALYPLLGPILGRIGKGPTW